MNEKILIALSLLMFAFSLDLAGQKIIKNPGTPEQAS